MASGGWVRNYTDSASGNKDRGAVREAYLVTGDMSPAAIMRNPSSFLSQTGEPLPEKGTPHPEFPELKLDSFDINRTGIVVEIIALYSNDGRFALPPIDPDDENTVIGYSSDFQDVTVKIPFGRITPTVTPIVGPPQQPGFIATAESPVYELKSRIIPESHISRSWEVLIRYRDIQQSEAAIWAQQDKLHKIGTTWYRYRGTGVQPTGEVRDGQKMYSLKHTWFRDRGTPFPVGLDHGLNTLVGGRKVANTLPGVKIYLARWIEEFTLGQTTTTGWLRPPFHSVVVNEAANIIEPPMFDVVCDYSVGYRDSGGLAGEGWRDLPGVL